MRILKFIVSGQQIKKDPSCEFSGIVAGTKGYLEVSFKFSDEWKGCKKAVVFNSLGKEYPVPLVEGKCNIPEGALSAKMFTVRVVGEYDGYRITTNKTEVFQDG